MSNRAYCIISLKSSRVIGLQAVMIADSSAAETDKLRIKTRKKTKITIKMTTIVMKASKGIKV
jgi:hypothetical protein